MARTIKLHNLNKLAALIHCRLQMNNWKKCPVIVLAETCLVVSQLSKDNIHFLRRGKISIFYKIKMLHILTKTAANCIIYSVGYATKSLTGKLWCLLF